MRLSYTLDEFPATMKRDMASSTSGAQADAGLISECSKNVVYSVLMDW